MKTRKICPQCGAENLENAKFCSNCGYKLENISVVDENSQITPEVQQTSHQTTQQPQPSPQQPQETNYTQQQPEQTFYQSNTFANTNFQQEFIKGFIEKNPQFAKEIDLWSAYVQTKLDYYIPKFVEFEALNKKVSWNWAAFFFAPYWLAYRKMLGYGILTAIVNMIPLVGLVTMILFGLYGNYLYYRDTKEEVKQVLLQSNYLNADPKTVLYARGGTSIKNIFIVMAIIFVLVLIIKLITYTMTSSRYY